MNAYGQIAIPPTESVRWTGAPPGGILFRPSDLFAIPFSLFWGGFALFWESAVVSSGGPLLMRLWGVPFVCVGLYLIAGRFFWDAYVRSHTRYAVTDRAAYVEIGGVRPSLRRFAGAALDGTRYVTSPDGTGTIEFVGMAGYGRTAGAGFWQTPPNAFMRVRDAAGAYAAMLAARSAG